MTTKQSCQITELRLKGNGYRTIATVVGLSRDIVRNYCKSHTLAGYAGKWEREPEVNCKYCGMYLKQPSTGRHRLFCSDSCRRSWWSAHPNLSRRKSTAYYSATCKYCGKEFEAYGNDHRKYCCHNCYLLDRYGSGETNFTHKPQ